MNTIEVNHIADIAQEAHEGQTRDNGTDYFDDHVYGVVRLLWNAASLKQTRSKHFNILCAVAYLHDVIEDCDEWMETHDLDIEVNESIHDTDVYDTIMYSIRWLTTSGPRIDPNIYPVRFSTKQSRLQELMMFGTPYAICVKLADRTHNLQSMGQSWDEKRQRKYIEKSTIMLESFYRGLCAWSGAYNPVVLSIALKLASQMVDVIGELE